MGTAYGVLLKGKHTPVRGDSTYQGAGLSGTGPVSLRGRSLGATGDAMPTLAHGGVYGFGSRQRAQGG